MDFYMEFRSKTVQRALKEAHQAAKATAPDGEPYGSKYTAAKILGGCQKICDVYEQEGSTTERDALQEAIAVVTCQRAMYLLETDLVSEAETSITEALEVLELSPQRFGALLQQIYNSVAVLWTSRDQTANALELLKRSEGLYPQIVVVKGRSAGGASPQSADGAGGSLAELSLNSGAESEAWWQQPLGITARTVDREHIQTLFLQAQVYGQLQEHEQSASYCAATLQKQLQARSNAEEWVRNCLGLAEYYSGSVQEFAVAEYLMHAATQVSAVPGAVLEASLPALKAEVALEWASLFARRLEASRQRRAASAASHPDPGQLTSVPDSVRFDLPGLPQDSSLPWGSAALAEDFTAAKQLFQQALQGLQDAMKHFTLETHASRHCEIALQINNLYRDIVDFETDDHKQCVMHKARATRLEPLAKVLNQQAFPSLYWSLRMEIASAYREIMLIKEEHKRPFGKVAAAAKQAEVHLRAYLDTFGDSKSLPDRVDGVDQGDYVNCCYRLAQVLHKMQPPLELGTKPNLKWLQESTRLYRYAAGYIQRNNVTDSRMLEQPCKEMAELLDDKAKWIMMTSR